MNARNLALVLLLWFASSALAQVPPAPSPQSAENQTLPQRAWSMLVAGANDKSAEKRAAAVRVLGLLGRDRRTVALAQSALVDQNPGVRAAAATALGEMNATSAAPALRNLLGDKETSVVL